MKIILKNKKSRLLYPVVGLLLAGWLIWRLDPREIWGQLAGASWRSFGLVVLAFVLQQALGTAALWILGTREDGPGWKATSLRRLARVRYAGEVLNYAMPTGAVGGEPYKYLMLRGAEDRRASFHALAAAKFLHLAGTGPFACIVFFSAVLNGTGGKALQPVFILAGLMTFLVTAGAWSLMLWQGTGRTLLGGFYRIRRKVPRRLWKIRRLLYLDRAVALHVKNAWGRTAVAAICYIGMWWAAAFEWIAIAETLDLGWRGLGLTGGGLFVCATFIVNGLIPVPAGVGTQEAGKIIIANMLGLSSQAGLAMSLVRRAREILMVVAAFLIALPDLRRGKLKVRHFASAAKTE